MRYPNYSLNPFEVAGWTYPPDIRRELPKYQARLAEVQTHIGYYDLHAYPPTARMQRFEALRAIVDILEAKHRAL